MSNSIELTKHNDIKRLAKACAACSPQQLEAVDFYGNTALLKSCYMGKLEAVRVLLSFHANLHAINYFGQNALTLATYSGCYDTVCELLKYRSYTDFALSSMVPPICVAVLKGHNHLVKLYQHIQPNSTSGQTVHGVSVADLQDMQREVRRSS